MGGGRQLSFGSVEMTSPSVIDLAGLLVGPGHLVVAHGMARVSTVLADRWRVDALIAELAARDLAPTTEPTEAGLSVRTTFTPRLEELLAMWTRGAVRVAPRGLTLSGGALRLWCIAGGQPVHPSDTGSVTGTVTGSVTGTATGTEAHGWHLTLASEPAGWPAIGAALAATGLTAALVGPRGDGPAYRLAGTRRVKRLAELIGEAPPGAPTWPA